MADEESIAQNWNTLGASVSVNGESIESDFTDQYTGNYQATIGLEPGPTLVDPYSYYQVLLDSAESAPVGKVSTIDDERFTSATANSLLQQWADATSDAQRQQAMDGLEDIMATQTPVIPLYSATDRSEGTNVNITGWPTAQNDYQIPFIYGFEGENVLLHLKSAG